MTQTTKKHRIAVIGCGAHAQGSHLPNIKNNPRMTLAVTCDRDPLVAEDCCQKFGSERSETDWRKVIQAADIDLILLATHTNLRGELIIPALHAGKAIYTEKPLSSNRQEMIDIVQTARATKTPICVGHNRRSSPAVLELKRLVEKARGATCVSRPALDRGLNRKPLPEQKQTQILMRINDDVRSWEDWIFWDEEGIMFTEMVHSIDLALMLHESSPVRVFAEGSARGNFVMMLRFADGSIANFHQTFVGNFGFPKELIEVAVNQVTLSLEQHIEVKQCGLLDEPMRQVFPYSPCSSWVKGEGLSGYFEGLEAEQKLSLAENRSARWLNVVKGHAGHLDRFLTHLEGGGPNPCEVESAIVVSRIAMKFIESVRLGIPIAVGPEDWHIPG